LQEELLTTNVAAGRFKFPEQIDARKTPTWITSFSEHQKYIDLARATDPDVWAIFVMGFCFGLRPEETLGLDIESIDFERGVVRVVQVYTQSVGVPDLTPPKTTKSRREIPMTDYAKAQLKAICGKRESGALLLRHGKRMRPQRSYAIVKQFCDKHPELQRVTMENLRHSFATACILEGIDVASVSKWLGHSHISTTLNRYVKPLQTDIERASRRINLAYVGS